MNHSIYLILTCCAISLVLSCTKEDVFTANNEKTIDVRTPEDKVDVCHLTGSGEYITININVNALDAHLAHGDTEGECSDCDANSCYFCDYLDYFDFDEPCDELGFLADFYCQNEIRNSDTPCGGEAVEGWARLVDFDKGLTTCFPNDPEGESDEGDIYAYYKTDGCGLWAGAVFISYNDNNGVNISNAFAGETQTAYEQALYCANVLIGINAGLPTPLVSPEGCLVEISFSW